MLLSLPHGTTNIEFEVVFRKRKTMAIRVEAPQKVTVFVPMGTSKRQILSRIQASMPWIIKKLKYYEAMEPVKPKEFCHGEKYMFLGIEYPLQISIVSNSKRMEVRLGQDILIVEAPEQDQDIKKAIEKWYRQAAQTIIKGRLEYYQPMIGKSPNRIVIKEQKKRWGSCSSKGNLNFNWKIIMAPQPVVDYIVVHELCHMEYLNHSQEFWHLVESILPDYRMQKDWLNKFGFTLSL